MTTMIDDKRDQFSSLCENNNPIYFTQNTLDKSLSSSLRSKNTRLVYIEYQSESLEKPKNKLNKRDEIDKLSTFEEILKYEIDAIKLKEDYFFNRIRELKELCDSEDYDVSLKSLKTMILLIEAIGNISKPTSLTVSESGLFHLEWERDRNNSITVRFKKDYFLDYVIFKPSLHIINKRIILNGSMYALDLIDYLNDLNIKIHKKI